MGNLKHEISLLLTILSIAVFIISFSGCVEEGPDTESEIGINSSEESKLYDELNGIVKAHVAEKDNITDQSLIWTSVSFKSKDEAFVSVTIKNKTWSGTWKYSNNQWNPGEDFKSY
jgi:uncharacterized lipoprotein YehR (DUF1307 family)